jgi:ABC-type multidrug transport system ATPase subunit
LKESVLTQPFTPQTPIERHEEIMRLLDLTQLREKIDDRIETLSGGQKRKVSVAVTLLQNPDIVIMDNLTNGIDVASQRTIWGLLETEKQGKTIILSTNSLLEAQIADRVTILNDGEMICSGSVGFLKKQYMVGEYVLTIDKVANVDQKYRKYVNFTSF